jgi:hypothetical protein
LQLACLRHTDNNCICAVCRLLLHLQRLCATSHHQSRTTPTGCSTFTAPSCPAVLRTPQTVRWNAWPKWVGCVSVSGSTLQDRLRSELWCDHDVQHCGVGRLCQCVGQHTRVKCRAQQAGGSWVGRWWCRSWVQECQVLGPGSEPMREPTTRSLTLLAGWM